MGATGPACERCLHRCGHYYRIGSSYHVLCKECSIEIAKEMLRMRIRNPPLKPPKVPVQPPPVKEMLPRESTPIEEAALERRLIRAARGGYRGPQGDRKPPEARLEAALEELDKVNAEAHRIRSQNLKAKLGVTVVTMMILGAFVTLLVAVGL